MALNFEFAHVVTIFWGAVLSVLVVFSVERYYRVFDGVMHVLVLTAIQLSVAGGCYSAFL